MLQQNLPRAQTSSKPETQIAPVTVLTSESTNEPAQSGQRITNWRDVTSIQDLTHVRSTGKKIQPSEAEPARETFGVTPRSDLSIRDRSKEQKGPGTRPAAHKITENFNSTEISTNSPTRLVADQPCTIGASRRGAPPEGEDGSLIPAAAEPASVLALLLSTSQFFSPFSFSLSTLYSLTCFFVFYGAAPTV
jgi:hypothetical protein